MLAKILGGQDNYTRGNKMHWLLANKPPPASVGKLSREVVVMTNYGDIFLLSYCGGETDGCWQRPARFNKGEKVEYWTDKPDYNPAGDVQDLL